MTTRHTRLRVALQRPWPTTRRGLCLWLFALGFIAIGFVNYIGTDLPPSVQMQLSFALILAPAHVWGWIMVGFGTVALWSSYCHLGRDRYGFTLLATFCAGWGLGYLSGGLFYDAGWRAVGSSVIWFLFAAILVLLAGFPNVNLGKPPPLVSPEREQTE